MLITESQGRDQVSISALGLLISLYQNESSRLLQNSTETSVLFFERLQNFRKISISSSPFIL